MRYHESWQERGKKAERWMWLVTTLEQTAPEILWEMMNRRWDIEEKKIIKSGYDIISTAKELEQIYLNMSAEEKND